MDTIPALASTDFRNIEPDDAATIMGFPFRARATQSSRPMLLQELRVVPNAVPPCFVIRAPLAPWMRGLQCLLTFLLFQFLIQKSDAADISKHYATSSQPDIIVIDGIILPEDQANFAASCGWPGAQGILGREPISAFMHPSSSGMER
jgi:hypothetical protein